MPYARHQDYRKIIDRKVPPGTRIFNGTWVSGKSFQINTDDPFVKELHSIQKLPFLIEKKTFGIILIVIFIANALFNISYELIIPFFENTMNENSSEFKTIDDLVFYSTLPLLLLLWDNREYQFCAILQIPNVCGCIC